MNDKASLGSRVLQFEGFEGLGLIWLRMWCLSFAGTRFGVEDFGLKAS